jgi:DNA-binding transcriptional MerR regulator
MGAKTYTIGELARLSGQPVRRIRFYSDRGLLPPTVRTDSNYRLYGEGDLARLDLIGALREAGVGLDAIGTLLRAHGDIRDVLGARLAILDAEIAAKRRIASVLRAALDLPHLDVDTMRRYWKMSRVSNEQMKALVAAFMERVTSGAPIDDTWRSRMADVAPELPEHPTPAQIDAWTELAGMLRDPDVMREFQTAIGTFWDGARDAEAYREAAVSGYQAASGAIARGAAATGPEGIAIGRAWLDASARAMGRAADEGFLRWLLDQYAVPAGARERMRAALRMALAQPKGWMRDEEMLHVRLALRAALGTDLGTVQPVVPDNLDALPTIALLDWVRYVLATPDNALRRSRLDAAAANLRNRYDLQGTRLRWRSGDQQRWWMMWTGDVVAARTALLVQQWAQVDARWQEDLPRMIAALVDLQVNGHWNTTVANAWGVAALRRFAQTAEGVPVTGTSTATLAAKTVERTWPEPAPALLPWSRDGGAATLELNHKGTGAPWATVQVKAALRGEQAVAHGLAIGKTVTPVEQHVPGRWSEDDVMRVTLHIVSHGDNGWLVIDDPIPSGASILNKGLGGESVQAQQAAFTPRDPWWSQPSYIERGSDSYRAYYARISAGEWNLSYTVRLNNAGTFQFPATRVEAMYAPEIFGEAPNASLEVAPR